MQSEELFIIHSFQKYHIIEGRLSLLSTSSWSHSSRLSYLAIYKM